MQPEGNLIHSVSVLIPGELHTRGAPPSEVSDPGFRRHSSGWEPHAEHVPTVPWP